MIYIFVFIIGTLIGSFLNVCIYRIPRGESIAYPPSHCTNCGKRIKPSDLAPMLGYIFLKGRCRYCREKISIQYPLIETLTGLIFTGLYYKYGLAPEFAAYCFFTSVLIIIAMIDFKTNDVYTSTIITGGIGAMIFIIYKILTGQPYLTHLLGAAAGSGIIALIIILTRGGMGWGDVEIILVCGMFIGLKLTLLTLFLSFLTGGITGVFLLCTKKKGRKDSIPFGPYIALSSIISLIAGDVIITWYLKIL